MAKLVDGYYKFVNHFSQFLKVIVILEYFVSLFIYTFKVNNGGVDGVCYDGLDNKFTLKMEYGDFGNSCMSSATGFQFLYI